MRQIRLTLFLCGVSLHRLTEYRVDFLLGAFGFIIRVGAQIILVHVVFALVPSVYGWGYYHALFLLGFALLPRGLDRLFTDNLWMLSGQYVRTGEFYRYLIRPVRPLFLLVSDRFFWPDALGDLITGVTLLAYATGHLTLGVPPVVAVALTPILVLLGAVVYFSVKLAFASLAFWTTTSYPVMHAANELSEFAGFPLDLYRPTVRWVLTWVVPFAVTSYFPATFLLFGDRAHLLWIPTTSLGALAVACLIWRAGLRRYEMTGS
ncbi:ABC transporter permease [Streptomyces sp. bgisy153]|uniref:ABC transporter permease n=1 Tax=Streptomyces sp. bgisy153 TaxID=3413793 RepID=UPI003D765415